MYETFMHTLRAFFSTGILRTALAGSLALIVIALAAYASPAFRESLARMRERRGWRATLADLGTGVFKLALIFVMARLFITALNYQARLFEQEHGHITERNRSAVLMKWGYPHEQRELRVRHTRKRVWVTRQLLLKQDEGEDRVLSESYWKDEEAPIQAVNGKLPALLSTKEEDRDVPVVQKSIISADVDIAVTDNPRRLGNANYAGYDDLWKMKYVVANKSEWKTSANMSIRLPAKTGLFDEMYLRVDGKDVLEIAETRNSDICWIVEMEPSSRCTVEYGYSSRGLEHLRYIPRRMTQTGHYRVTMAVNGIPAHRLDYPIGSMPPAENLTDLKGDPYKLTWKLDNAMTSYDIGIKLPVAEQPEYHFANLLGEAPVGLILLLVLLVLPALITGETVRPAVIGVMGTVYCLHYTFMGRLADLMTGFGGPFFISAIATVAVAAWFRLRDRSKGLLPTQDPVAFAAMAVLYPVAIVDAERTAFWMQLFYLATVIYACALLVRYRLKGGQALT
jgi:hypothetical protein